MLSLSQEIGRLEAKLLVGGRGLLISGKTTDSSGRGPLIFKAQKSLSVRRKASREYVLTPL
jgi:hypothetical protein